MEDNEELKKDLQEGKASASSILDKLRYITSMPSEDEISDAMIEARKLGDYALVNAIKDAVKLAEERIAEEKAKVAMLVDSTQIQGPITSATEYFNRKETQQIRETLKDIELGKQTSSKKLIKIVEDLDSEDARLLRKETIEKLEEEQKRYLKERIQNIQAIDEQGLKYLHKIDEQIDELRSYDDLSAIISNSIGSQRNKEERAKAVKEHKFELIGAMEEYLVNGPKQRIQKLESATHHLFEIANNNVKNGGVEVAQNLSKVEVVLKKAKEEILKDGAEAVSKISKEKIFSEKENIADLSAREKDRDNKLMKAAAIKAAVLAKKRGIKLEKDSAYSPTVPQFYKVGNKIQSY